MTLRVACVGAGYFSQFHYDGWARLADVSVVGACDLDLSRAQATGHPAFDELQAMLEDTAPDLLDIILPPAAQAQAVRTALDAGVRWIICQKPFCQDLHEATTIVEDAEAAGATLVVHENFRFQPWYRVIKTEIEAGTLGTVQNATFRLRPGDGQGPRAYLDRQPYFQTMPRFLIHETGVHWIDTFRYLFGPITHVYADLRQLNPALAGEDAGVVLFDHASGVRSVFDGNRHVDHDTDNSRRTMGEALVEGTDAVLTLAGDGSVLRRGHGARGGHCVLDPDRSDGFGGDCVFALQSHVVRAWQEGTVPENTGRDYLTVLALTEAMYASAAGGHKIKVVD